MIRIYYGDYTTADVEIDREALWKLPPRNTVGFVHPDPDPSPRSAGWLVTHNWDYYFVHENGEIWGEKGICDFEEHVLHTPHLRVFKGRNIPHNDFHTILRNMKAYAQELGKSATKVRQEDGDYYEFSQRREVGKR